MAFKVDIHTHILPPDIPNWNQKFGYDGFITLQDHDGNCCSMMKSNKFFRRIEDNCYNAERRIEESDHFGVHVQVLSTVPVMFAYFAEPDHGLEVARFLNDHIADVVTENPKRFIGLGTLPMQAPDLAVQELRRCIQDLGFAGVQIGSHVNKWNLNEPELFPIFEEAERLNAVIFVHPWDMMGQTEMEKYWLPWLVGMPAETTRAICSLIFGGVLERLPNLKVAFAHGAGSFPGTIGRIEHGFNCRPDLCAIDNDINPREYCKKIYVDSLVHDQRALQLLLDTFPTENIMLGTDYPFPLGELEPGKLIESMTDLEKDAKAKLLGENAMKFLGRRMEDYI
jgi:aminocarboxymuconate-semialdehyde decarboxylase